MALDIFAVRDFMDPDRPREVEDMKRFINICLNDHVHIAIVPKKSELRIQYYMIGCFTGNLVPHGSNRDMFNEKIPFSISKLPELFKAWNENDISILNDIFNSAGLMKDITRIEWENRNARGNK